MAGEKGVARATFKHGGCGHVIELAHPGVDRRPATDRDGMASMTNRCGGRGNLAEIALSSAGGQPTPQ
jgi:hypothetical protein